MHNSQPFHLDTPRSLALRLAAGDRVHVTQGSIWLTLEGHSRDVWLKAHERWTVPLDANVWISAEAHAAFTVSQPVTELPARVAKPARNRRLRVTVAV